MFITVTSCSQLWKLLSRPYLRTKLSEQLIYSTSNDRQKFKVYITEVYYSKRFRTLLILPFSVIIEIGFDMRTV